MTAADQIREGLRVHREGCELCRFSQCTVAAGIAHDLRRALDEQEHQSDLFGARKRLDAARLDCYQDAKRKGIL